MTGPSNYTNLPQDIVRLDPVSGKILDSYITSNIVRLMADGTINPALLPVATQPQSTLLRTSDKVGIGLRNPQQKLHVNGNQCLTNGRMSIGTITPLSPFHLVDDNGGVASSFLLENNGSTDTVQINTKGYPSLYIAANSNIGVGISGPSYALDVNGVVRSTGGLRTNTIMSDGSVINCSTASLSNLQSVTTNNLIVNSNITIPAAHISSTVTNTVYTNTLAPNNGVSTIQMPASLQITGYDASLWSSSNYSVGDTLGLTQIGLKVNQCITTRALLTTSDLRAKQNIVTINSANDLQKVLKIPVRSFAYKEYPDVIVPGFVAQEVEPIEPAAIKTTLAPLPSVLKAGVFINPSKISLKNHTIAEGTVIKLVKNEDEYIRRVVTIEKDDFTIDKEIPSSENDDVFVYGEVVNDFKMIDSTRLIPMLFNSIKELSKTIDTLNTRIAVLEQNQNTRRR